MAKSEFARNVFLNCPLDKEYEPVLQAVLFCLVRLGLRPRIATERSDAGETRLSKILELIKSSRYSVRKVRNWLAGLGGFGNVVGAASILAEYEDFQEWYYKRQLEAGFSQRDIQDCSTAELLEAMSTWTGQGRPRE